MFFDLAKIQPWPMLDTGGKEFVIGFKVNIDRVILNRPKPVNIVFYNNPSKFQTQSISMDV
jgi:hypothetical protein